MRRSAFAGGLRRRRRLGRLRHAAQHAAHPRQQFAQLVGLDHIVVGAELQPDDAVDGGAGGGGVDDADRHLRAQPAAERQAVLAGHGDVEDGEMEGFGLDQLAHGVGALGSRHVIAVGAEILGDGIPQIGLVLDDGDPCRQGNLASAIGGK